MMYADVKEAAKAGILSAPFVSVKKTTSPETLVPEYSIRPEILFISSYPPRQCGIATYTQDLTHAINEKFNTSLGIKICALENTVTTHLYPEEVKYVLNTSDIKAYEDLAAKLNLDRNLSLVVLQHEFGLFNGPYGKNLLALLCLLSKPVITTFHTILPAPDATRKKIVQTIAKNSARVVVMTLNSAALLEQEYEVPKEKIKIIPHGTHLSSSFNHTEKSARNHFGNRMVLTTFGLLSPDKSIETALDALPAIIEKFPNVLYLIIGKTHPDVIERAGEQYRNMLEQKVLNLKLQGHVRFVNKYLPLADLLGYLQRTDVYLFTSKNPYQAVSGTFAYAMGCGCPVISTPIPHAKEMLGGAGIIVDFQQPQQLANETIKLLSDTTLMRDMKLNALHKIRPTAWPNAALAHVDLILKHMIQTQIDKTDLRFNLPPISLAHIHKLTTSRGMIQFSKLSVPDLNSGYTIDDNARALITLCHYYEVYRNETVLPLIETYLNFIISCQTENGAFFNYLDKEGVPELKNQNENLEDANGRAIWALGEFLAHSTYFKKSWLDAAEHALLNALPRAIKMRSPRAMSFVIKGLFCYTQHRKNDEISRSIVLLADDLVSKYRTISDNKWRWFEEYLTYANAAIPEALLCAYLATGKESFKVVAKSCFDFLLSIVLKKDEIKVISNQGWLKKGKRSHPFGEQPIDVAYTILALDRFHEVFPTAGYSKKLIIAFNWFLGKNHLQQIMYNPVTGGCYDGLEQKHINLNQGAESTISYLLSRLVMVKNFNSSRPPKMKLLNERLQP